MVAFINREPLFLKLRASNVFILTSVCLAAFTDGFLYAVVVPVLPFSLRNESNIPESEVQRWSSYLLTIFGAATLVTSPLAGWLADWTSSRKIPFLIGLFLQAASTCLFLVSPKVEILMLARALQGLSAAVVYSVGLAVLVDTVGMADIATSAGYFLSSANMGVLISPLIGGFVYSKAGYKAVIAMMISLVAIDIFLRLSMIEKSTAARWSDNGEEASIYQRLPTTDPEYGTMEDEEVAPATKKAAIPPFLRLLINPRALGDLYAVLVAYILLSAFDAGLAVFIKQQFHWSPSSAGASFLAIALPSLLSPIGGTLSGKFGPKWVITAGFTVSAIALFGVGFIEQASLRQLIALYVLLILIGSGIALLLPCVADDLTAIATEMEGPRSKPGGRGAYAQAFALFNCGIAGGTIIGPLWMSSNDFGWQPATAALGALALSACIPILSCYEGRTEIQKQEELIE